MKATVYLSRKLLNQLKVKETESKDLMVNYSAIELPSIKRRGLTLDSPRA